MNFLFKVSFKEEGLLLAEEVELLESGDVVLCGVNCRSLPIGSFLPLLDYSYLFRVIFSCKLSSVLS